MNRFELAHNTKPNLILLGFDDIDNFLATVEDVCRPVTMADVRGGEGVFFRGCRVVKTDAPGIWVGRVISPS